MPALRHLHIHPHALTRYAHASRLQESLVQQFLKHKADPTTHAAPPPTLLTFSPWPVYTAGRRQAGTYNPAQITALTQQMTSFEVADPRAHTLYTPRFYEAKRGGQITFHGPGQLVAYPIVDLKPLDLTSRCYVHKLEASVIALLDRYGIAGKRTENPGVWVDDDKKIAALGVHLRRYISSHGVAINVHTDLRWFERIVACGLEGKKTTSLLAEGVGGIKTPSGQSETAHFDPRLEDVSRVFAGTLAEKLGFQDGVETISEPWALFEEGTWEWKRLRELAQAEEEVQGIGQEDEPLEWE